MADGYYGPIQDPRLSAVADKYKALAPYMSESEIVQSPKAAGDDRHLEFYSPTETENPRPGKLTFELFDKMGPQDTQNAVAADALHYLGGTTGGAPNDPQWLKMKNELMSYRSGPQQAIDQDEYQQSREPGDTMDSWLQRSRADAYTRAGVFPEQNPEWQLPVGDPEGFTPDQRAIFGKMQSYLRNGATEPPPFEQGGQQMGYYDQPSKRPPTQPPPFDPNTPAATQPPPFDPTAAYAQQPPPAAPLAGNYDSGPAMPSQVPEGMTLEGLKQMMSQQRSSGRPVGGYYAQPSAGDALAQALMAVRQNNAPRR